MAKRTGLCARGSDSGPRRRSIAMLVNIALLSLAAFSTSVDATDTDTAGDELPSQAAGFYGTTPGSLASLTSSPSQDAFSFIQGETLSTSSIARGSLPGTPGQLSIISSAAGVTRIGGFNPTTSDEFGSQISSSSIVVATWASENPGVVSTSQLPNLSFTRDLPGTSSYTSSNTFSQITTARNNTSTRVSSSLTTLTSSLKPSSSTGNVPTSISQTPSRTTITSSTTTGRDHLITMSASVSVDPEPTCISTTDGQMPTTFSIVYTSTTTFYGDPKDYTPPYPEITTPITCAPPTESAPGRSTVLPCSGISCTSTIVGLPSTATSWKVDPHTTFTFVTTAKNPSVVFSTISTPRYGQNSETKPPPDKHTAVEKPAEKSTDRPPPKDQRPPDSPVPPRETAKEPPKATYTVTVAPTKVIINDHSFTMTKPSETTHVDVGGAHFTINPSEVVGGGTVIHRPANGGRSTVAPSSTMVGEIPVIIAPQRSQNVVVVGGTTFELQPTPVTAVVQGQTITIQSSGIVFPEQTVSISRSAQEQKQIVVAGGEMMTVIGPTVVVIRSTTLTYGLVSSTITEVVDDDTILVGPLGVVVHNMTMGGPYAKPTDTTYEIVGGATITQVGASLVVVGGTTFTVGPGRGTTTTVIGGETITIGPSGVAVSTLSFSYPFGPTVITTFSAPTTTAAPAPMPSETKTNGGAAVRYARTRTGIHLEACIAISVWVLGLMV